MPTLSIVTDLRGTRDKIEVSDNVHLMPPVDQTFDEFVAWFADRGIHANVGGPFFDYG